MRHSRLLVSMIITISITYALTGRPPDTRKMAGWYNIFNPTKKHLSPFEGFVFRKNVENYYRFGAIEVVREPGKNPERDMPVIKSIKSGDANIRLLLYFFYDRGSEFVLVNEPSKIAHYLDAVAIGKIVMAIDAACEHNNRSFILPDRTLSAAWQAAQAIAVEYKQLRGKSAPEEKIQSVERRLYRANTELKKLLLVAHLDLYPTENVYDILVNAVAGSSASSKNAKKEAYSLAETIIEALQESGDLTVAPGEKRLAQYIPHMPFLTILAFLYEKAHSSEDFIKYLKQLDTSFYDQQRESIIAKPFDSAEFLMTVKTELKPEEWNTSFDEIVNAYVGASNVRTDEKLTFFRSHYEDLCLQGSLASAILPPFIHDYSASINQVSFTACGEATLLNWIQLLMTKLGIYDHTQQLFNPATLVDALAKQLQAKQISINKEQLADKTEMIRSFFTRYDTLEKLNKENALDEWTALVSNVSGIKYSNRKKENEPNKKDSKHPALHPRESTEYPDYIELLGDDYFLYELPTYPSDLVQFTNRLLGTSCTSFADLCGLFDLASIDNLAEATDKEVYAGPKKFILTTMIDQKPVMVAITFSFAHGHLQDLNVRGKRSVDNVIIFLLSNYSAFVAPK